MASDSPTPPADPVQVTSVDELLELLAEWLLVPRTNSPTELDLRGLDWISSIALGRLVRWRQHHEPTEKLTIYLNEELEEIFKITRLDKFFELQKSKA